jgi:hypothetical protein
MWCDPLPQSSLLSSAIFADLVLPIGSVGMVIEVGSTLPPFIEPLFRNMHIGPS